MEYFKYIKTNNQLLITLYNIQESFSFNSFRPLKDRIFFSEGNFFIIKCDILLFLTKSLDSGLYIPMKLLLLFGKIL